MSDGLFYSQITKLNMRIYDYNYWNKTIKPSKEVEVKAIQDDLVLEIGGILYLIQRTNDCNNVVCFRLFESNMTTLTSFLELRKWLIANDIIYIRVEGNTKRYKFLEKVAKVEGAFCVQETKRIDRNIFYLKLI